MNIQTSTKQPLGVLVNEGKTKKIYQIKGNADLVCVLAKDDITAGDGAKHDIIPDKGRIATATTSNVFRLLKDCGLPVAFVEQDSATSFIAPELHHAALRGGGAPRGARLLSEAQPAFGEGAAVSASRWSSSTSRPRTRTGRASRSSPTIRCMHYEDGGKEMRLFNPAKPLIGQEPFLVLPTSEVFSRDDEAKFFPEMRRIARQTFLMLEKAWQLEGGTLVDLKVEFGFDSKGKLLLADVIDNDSWRVLQSGAYIDKQVYRDGGALDDVAAKYRQVAEITGHFRVPRQRIILWRGSDKDKTDAFADALGDLKDMMSVVTCSIHKEPVAGAAIFQRMIQEVPDTVVIAYIGRSNGAGPVLSAMSSIPVITVPASVKEFPEDVWSSLRAPSAVPVMTVLEPSNAVLAALQILSARNPRLYAHVRGAIEARTVNTIQL